MIDFDVDIFFIDVVGTFIPDNIVSDINQILINVKIENEEINVEITEHL